MFLPEDNQGPDLSKSKSDFVHRCTSAIDLSSTDFRKAFIINEIGSVHVSFTRDEVIIYFIFH